MFFCIALRATDLTVLLSRYSDPKIRVRVIKKGVTLGDLSHYYTTPLEGNDTNCNKLFLYNCSLNAQRISSVEREVANARLETQWRALLERRDHQDVLRMLQESQISTSGLLLRSVYRRCSPLAPVSGSPSPAAMEGGCWSPQLVRTLAEADLDLIRLVWERNSDQVSHPLSLQHRSGGNTFPTRSLRSGKYTASTR